MPKKQVNEKPNIPAYRAKIGEIIHHLVALGPSNGANVWISGKVGDQAFLEPVKMVSPVVEHRHGTNDATKEWVVIHGENFRILIFPDKEG